MKLKHVLVAGIAAVIAAVALGSGNAQAAVTRLIGSHDIKDNSVRLADLRAGAKDQLTEAPQVVAGAGYAGLGHHELWQPGYNETVQKCHDGEIAVGGGYSQAGGDATDLGGQNDVVVTVSAPYIDNYVPVSDQDSRFEATKWVVRGFNNTNEPVDVRAWVTCMS
jgi:hypothetical protein